MVNGLRDHKTCRSPKYSANPCSMYRKPLLFLLGMVLLAGASVLLVAMRNDAVEAGHCAKCQYRLKAIGLALCSYNQMNGSFPPAYLCDGAGKEVNSWRLLVADLAFYHHSVSRGYDVTRPPNAQGNIQFRLSDQPIEEFRCPSAGSEGPLVMNYVAVVGPNTMWPGREPAKPAADGSDNDKILVIETINSDILWFEPRDLTLEQALDAIQPKKGIGIGSRHNDGIHYVTVGGEVRTLNHNIDRESLRRLLVRDLPKEDSPQAKSADTKSPTTPRPVNPIP